MFAKKEVVSQEPPKCVSARDVGLPYTKITLIVHYTMANGSEYNSTKYFYLLNYINCPTAKEAMRALYDNYFDTQNEYREQIVKNFGKHDGYIQFGNLFIRADQCIRIHMECYDNSDSVRNGHEETPDVNGWPWEKGSYHVD